MSTIFVRERRHVGEGAGRPRFAIVAAFGTDLHIYQTHIRKDELEKLAEAVAAEIIYLPRGEKAEGAEPAAGGHRRTTRRPRRREG